MPQRIPGAAALKPFHPIVRAWFRDTLGPPSPPQREGWPAIASGAHTLILAPTGTGKTLAAFLWELNQLIVRGLEAPLPNAVQILYISPLKALNNDIQRNLERPLAELRERFTAAGETFPEIRVAVRTGDTPSSARARMLRKAPHVLITTPESLHIMLTSVRGRGMFSGVRAVIVDEIHALAATKRGVHLALTLERLEERCARPPQRIGLSATQRPLSEVARFLVGSRLRDGEPDCRIVDCGLVKPLELVVRSPVDDLAHATGGVWPAITPLVLERIRAARTTLVFVNNRGQAERMAARVNALAGEELALPYHGSLSRDRRLMLEQMLKQGALRALISTSSLELGIDIGSVDLVIQLQSPKRVANGLQRVGRAGHSLDAVSRGVFVPTFRDDAMELLAVVRAMEDGDVEPTRVIQNSLDVLAQVVVACVAVDDWTSAELFQLVRRAYPYHQLTRAAFDEVLDMLAGRYPSDVAAELDARLSWDRLSDTLTAARGARMAAVISGGTIPDLGLYTVHLPDRTRLGELDEEFVHETRIGDVFQLGSSTWRVGAIEHDRVIVTPAPGAPARMPFWKGDYGARSPHLAPRVGELRRELDAARTDEQLALLARRYRADRETVASLADYVRQQREAVQGVPDERTLIIEQYRDEMDSLRVVLHAPFGGRVNAPWGLALANRVREWLAGRGAGPRRRAGASDGTGAVRLEGPSFEIQVQTTDDGIMLRLPNLRETVPPSLLTDMTAVEAEQRVLAEVGGSSLFGARFRMNAARALLLPRGTPRRRMPLWLQRLKALDLLEAVREFPSFPILVETYRDVLQDAFDLTSLGRVLDDLATGTIAYRPVETQRPSPFAASMQLGFVMDWLYADDAPRAERRAALLSLDRALLGELMGTEGAGIDESTLAVLETLLARRRGTLPGTQARTAEELAALIDRASDLTLPEVHERIATEDGARRGDPLGELLGRNRAVAIDVPRGSGEVERRVILAETFPRYVAAFGAARFTTVYAGPDLEPRPAIEVIPEGLRRPAITAQTARRELLVRFVSLSGPFTAIDVLARYDLDPRWVEERLAEWTSTGRLIRGAFGGDETPRWVSRRLLEQARRRELAQARRQIEAVDLQRFSRFMQRWQHLDPAARMDGGDGATVVRQMAGLARPAERWERDYLPARLDPYDPDAIARLISAGELVWVGGSRSTNPHEPPDLATIRFIRRGTGRAWLPAVEPPPLGEQARRVEEALRREGASFFDELLSSTGLTTRALRDALRELAGAGLVTNDTLESMREVVRWRPLVSPRDRAQPDPTRWLPADFAPSANRYVVQRRPNLRRMPRWKRPDVDGGQESTWPGRWSLVAVPRVMGPEQADESTLAELIARQWLERYGVVAREMWRRERPAMSWRAIYHELKRLEFRGDVRRGYFVRGLSGAQFALPDAVELLRSSSDDADDAPAVVLTAGDPANVFALPMPQDPARDPFVRPRSAATLLVTIAGRVVLLAEGRGQRVAVRPDVAGSATERAARALANHVSGRLGRDLIVETIDGQPAAGSPHAAAFRAAGFKRGTTGLRFYRTP